MKRCGLILLVLLLVAVPARGQVELPSKIQGEPGQPIYIRAETKAKAVAWMPLDPGLQMVEPSWMVDRTRVVVFAAAGSYRLMAIVNGDPAPGIALTTVVVGTVPPGPGPGPGPGPFAWPKPIVSVPAAGKKYYITIYTDPPSAALRSVAGDEPTWRKIEGMGNAFRHVESSTAGGKNYLALIAAYGQNPVPPFLLIVDPSITTTKNFVVVAPYPQTTDALLATVQKSAKKKGAANGGKR